MKHFATLYAILLAAVALSCQAEHQPEPQQELRKFKVVNMSWSDCADPATTGVKIKRIEVSDPVILPGPLSIGFDGTAIKPLVRGSPFFVRMQKKVSFLWVDVPCLKSADGGNRIGSCDYEDFCDHWPLPGPECAASYKDHGIPCECPFKEGNYSMPLLPVGEIKDVHLPKWLEKGVFRIQAWVTPKGSDVKLICINLNLNLDHP